MKSGVTKSLKRREKDAGILVLFNVKMKGEICPKQNLREYLVLMHEIFSMFPCLLQYHARLVFSLT